MAGLRFPLIWLCRLLTVRRISSFLSAFSCSPSWCCRSGMGGFVSGAAPDEHVSAKFASAVLG